VPTYLTPGVYVEEVPGGARPIEAVGTSTAAFVGVAPNPQAHLNQAFAVVNWTQFVREFVPSGGASTPLSHAVYGFFLNGGGRCFVVNVGPNGSIAGGGTGGRQGLQLLEEVDEVAIVAAPGYVDAASYDALLSHCEKMKDRVAILDPPEDVQDISQFEQVATLTPAAQPKAGKAAESAAAGDPPAKKGLRPRTSAGGYGAFYFPRIVVRDPFSSDSRQMAVAPSGHIAGLWARTDSLRGVHKAPANDTLRGALDLTYRLTDEEQGVLNPLGVNCIRFFSREGILVWGARTLADSASEWRYLNVRRLFNMIEESILDGTRWVVFEPNDRTLWKSVRRDIGAFLTRVWRDGALMGRSPAQAFFVQCDEETNPPDVIDAGMLVTVIGAAPVKPAEFIIFRLSQSAEGVAVTTSVAVPA
jgi:uncharacterized protein